MPNENAHDGWGQVERGGEGEKVQAQGCGGIRRRLCPL